MSRADKTPTPSRRFVHPSSSTSQSSASSRRPAPPFSQKPPSSAAVSSARNIRFGTPAIQKDDISTSFQSEPDTPSVSARTKPSSRLKVIPCDEIDASSAPSPEAHEAEVVEKWEARELETPVPKRRKRVHSSSISADPIAISSSPSDQDFAADSSDEDEVDPSDVTTIPATVSKFRTPGPTVKVEDSRSKPSFRPVEQASAVPSDMSTTLPDAFTPSRRKGKRDYVPGGLADTVRSWILQAATEETQREIEKEREVMIAEAVLDDSRRGVACKDTRGLDWLLVGSQRWGGSVLPSETVDRIVAGGNVIIRGSSTSWTVPLKSLGGNRHLHVAAHWELPP